MKRSSKRSRPEDGGSPSSSSGAADADFDFHAKSREFFLLCDRASLELQATRSSLKAAMELVEQKNRELDVQNAAIEAENETVVKLTEERDELARSRHALTEEFRAFKTRSVGETAKYRMLFEQRTVEVDDLRTQVQRMHQEAEATLRTEREAVQRLTAERDRLVIERDRMNETIEAAQENFTDCITLQRRPGVLLTSGQMLDLEGIIGVWFNNPRFNGDIWFPFQCPLTNKTTMPVHELTTLDFTDRLAWNLGLPSQQALFFRYKANPLDQEHQGIWRIYTLSEQLKIFSKLVLAYQRRDTLDAGFTVEVKTGHTISVHVKQNRVDEDIVDYDFAITLNVISLDGNRGVARQHAIQFSADPDAANRHFAYVNFVYPEPPMEIL